MNDDIQYFTQKSGLRTAYRYIKARENRPTIVFLPGYMSDMDGSKACAVFAHALQNMHGCLLLDYSGCGRSDGDFAKGSLSLWRDEVCAIINDKINGPVILIGSSMGGWLMLMVALKLGAPQLCCMIGIAAAPDFTNWGYSQDDRAVIARNGVLFEENPYGPEPTPLYQKFHDDGQANLFLGDEIAIDCPVILFHGQNDHDVPYDISVQLARHLRSSHVHINLIKNGDHRFSRDQDIAMLIGTLNIVIAEA